MDSGSTGGTFVDVVAQALEAFGDPDWLGSQSPLGRPYVLSRWLTRRPDIASPASRGRIVQRLLLEALATLDGASPDAQLSLEELQALLREGSREQRLVYWRFIHLPRLPVQVLIDHLGVAKATFHRDMKDRMPPALNLAAQALLRILRPGLSLEAPPTGALYGRAALLDAAYQQLEATQQLQLVGGAGAGKTACAAALTQQWPGPVFWLTLRSGLNDTLPALLPLLGEFFHLHGAALLAQQVLADGAAIRPSVALSLLRADCTALERVPLLCFDGLDQLLTADAAPQVALRSFLEALLEVPHLAVLLTGPLPLRSTLPHILVPALEPAAVQTWLDGAGVAPSSAMQLCADQLYGHPQLLQSLLILHRLGQPVAPGPAVAGELAIDAFWLQASRGLRPAEREALELLAVFALPVPAPEFAADQAVLERLIDYGLAHTAGMDAVTIWPVLRLAVLGQMSAERRRTCHTVAATLRARLGLFTAAAEHLVAAELFAEALMLWFPQREAEIRAGQAQRALRLLTTIPTAALSDREAQVLTIARSELRKLSGAYTAALDDLELAQARPGPPALAANLALLQGAIWETQSMTSLALQAYEQALSLLEGATAHQMTGLYARRGAIFAYHERDFEAAEREARMAEYTVRLFQGELADEQGDYAAATSHFHAALALAELLRDPLRQTRAHFNLAIVLARHEDAAALPHFAQVLRFYEQIGDSVRSYRTRANLASFHIQQGNVTAALPLAEAAHSFFERIGSFYWSATCAINLGEIRCVQGDYTAAIQHIYAAINAEEAALMPYAFNVLGQIQLGQGQLESAAQTLRQSLDSASTDPFAAAPAWRLLGRVYLAQAAQPQAQAAFEQALALYTRLALPRECARTEALLASLPGPIRYSRA